MRQLNLLDDYVTLAGVMPAIKAAMNRVAGASESEGRDILLDKINTVARHYGMKLTTGNAKAVSRDTLDKWLSPSDTSHPPSVSAILAFYKATGDAAPLHIMLGAVGLDVMTEEDRKYRDFGKAHKEMEAARKRLRKIKEDL